jgi:WhiB family redox-sensing transcriptional regulator
MTNVARLPGPIADIWDWQRMGLCRGRDSAQFFHPDGERGASRSRREATAKQLCQSCPVRAECAAHALVTREPYGVWGGFTEAERLRLLATGWEDAADRQRARVDVGRLEARLGLRPAPSRGTAAPSRGGVTPRGGATSGPRVVPPHGAVPPGRRAVPPHETTPASRRAVPAAAATAPRNTVPTVLAPRTVLPAPRSGVAPRPAVAR